MPTIKINEKSKEIKLKRGESNWVTLDSVGSNVSISDAGTINIVDRAFDGLKNPTVVQAIENNFCNKYKLKSNASFIICSDYEDGDVVLAFDGKRYLLLEVEGELKRDVADEQIIDVDEDNIFGSVFRKLERF
jgi:hypothetical protein